MPRNYEHEQEDPAYWLEGLDRKCEALAYVAKDARKALMSDKTTDQISDLMAELDNEYDRIKNCVRSALYAWEKERNR